MKYAICSIGSFILPLHTHKNGHSLEQFKKS